MGTPNHVQHPDEQPAVSNQDKHPDIQGPSPATSEPTAYTRKSAEAQRETHELRPKSIGAEVGQFTHNCVGGKVPRNCEKCGASYIAGMTCRSCWGTKVVWEACDECKRLVGEETFEDGSAEEVR